MKKISIVGIMFCMISFAASIVFADYCTITKMPTRTATIYVESVPANSAEVTTVQNRVLIEEVDINNSIEKAPSKTPGADIVKNTAVAEDVTARQPIGQVAFADGKVTEFYTMDEFNTFVANNNDNITGATSISINDMTAGGIINSHVSGPIDSGSIINMSYDSFISNSGISVITAPLAQNEGSITITSAGVIPDGHVMTSTGAGSTRAGSFSNSVVNELEDKLPAEVTKNKGDVARNSYNKNVSNKMDKRNKEIRGRMDEI